ncbi:MAG TPA: hypothetical protein VJT09_01730 [Pyrinomonadaceae bacterium]|nr:hypothetical protein [Pyrinomonadaceae bacterium]
MMLLKKSTLLLIVVIALLGLAGWSGYAQKKSPGTAVWEYKEAVNVSEPQVNVLGVQGWEMVGFSVDSNGNKFMYFKRAK